MAPADLRPFLLLSRAWQASPPVSRGHSSVHLSSCSSAHTQGLLSAPGSPFAPQGSACCFLCLGSCLPPHPTAVGVPPHPSPGTWDVPLGAIPNLCAS